MRLVDWPRDLGAATVTPTNGPLVTSGGETRSSTNYMQSFSRPGFRWEFSLVMPPVQFDGARSVRGWIMSLQGGANITRYRHIDQHDIRPTQYGMQASVLRTVPWTNGQAWANGKNWRASHPIVSLASAAQRGATSISLSNEYWGRFLGIGDQIGFIEHYGMYMITEVLGLGQYRIYPKLDAAQASGSYATLHPRLAMRLSGPGAASMNDVPIHVTSSVTLVQVTHSELQRSGLI